MTASSELAHFIQQVAPMPLGVSDRAVACLWYADHYESGCEKTAGELAKQMHSTGLTGSVNLYRLGAGLRASRYTVHGTKRNSFQISIARKPELDKRYLPLLKSPKVEVSDTMLPENLVKGTRPYLEQVAQQINGSYQFGFYDGCAVLCRRMVESLLIEAFDNKQQLAAIQDANGSILGLEHVLGQATSRRFITLGRTTGKNIERIKEIGDTAAHDRYHITTEQDIADFRSGFRKVVSELMALASITPKH